MILKFEAFRDGEIDGVQLSSGQIVAELNTELSLPAFKQALASGLIEHVPTKPTPAPTEA